MDYTEFYLKYIEPVLKEQNISDKVTFSFKDRLLDNISREPKKELEWKDLYLHEQREVILQSVLKLNVFKTKVNYELEIPDQTNHGAKYINTISAYVSLEWIILSNLNFGPETLLNCFEKIKKLNVF